jgi:GABA permease
MRIPVRSERDAYRIVWATVAVVLVAVAIGLLVNPWVGVALVVVALVAAVVWDVRAPNPDRVEVLREAAGTGREHAVGKQSRLLVVANQTLQGRELREQLLGRAPSPELRVVAPILISRVHYAMSDIDTELGLARRRLDEIVRWAKGEGFEVAGEVCPDGPLVAIEDQLRKFAADEIVISTHPPGRSNWLDAGVVERARAELDIPITHVVVDLTSTGAAVLDRGR